MRILHLYPNLMNLYGEYGNLTVLKKHLEDQGVDVTIERKEIEESIDVSRYDMIYMGSGTESAQLIALNDLMKYRHHLKKAVDEGKVILFTGNAMELCGKKIDDHKALDFIDFTVETTQKRYTGDVIAVNEEIGEVVGFINKSTLIHGGEKEKLFDYSFRYTTLEDNSYEGYRLHNLFGTHIIGPILVKNPSFMETIVKLLVKDGYEKIGYPYEEDAYNTTLQELKKRK
ncbi:MAG: hypothetical protein IJK53_11300 [Erysipelotrichaceae bacterium]|nr:hypothetical protein [Erysipelotrichaceae bacterium]